MGYDIYGLEPKENVEKPKILDQEWSELDKEEKDLYFEEQDKYEKENPGVYFRNNVWFWRPLWNYVCTVCEEVMSTKDVTAGYSNSGYEISKDVVDKMLGKLLIELASHNHISYEKKYMSDLDDLPLIECTLCEGTGTRNDEYVQGECNGCQGVGKRKSWETDYPFDYKNVEKFVSFLSESGGIRIC